MTDRFETDMGPVPGYDEDGNDLATMRPNHWFQSTTNHNCTFCPDDSIWKCDAVAHLQASQAEVDFIYLVVKKVHSFTSDLSPEEIVGAATRTVDALLHFGEGGMALTYENAVRTAALIAATIGGEADATD